MSPSDEVKIKEAIKKIQSWGISMKEFYVIQDDKHLGVAPKDLFWDNYNIIPGNNIYIIY